ncbi:MAG: WG repeat-containing protein [Treponema sp.]
MKKKVFFLVSCFLLCSYVFAKSYSTFCLNGFYGLIDENRKIVIDPIYSEISINPIKYIFCYENDGACKIYSSNLKLIYSLPKESLVVYHSEYEYVIQIKDKDKYLPAEVLNIKTEKITQYIPYPQNMIYRPFYKEGVAVVLFQPPSDKDEFLFTVIDKNGKIIVDNLKQADDWYSDGLLAVELKKGKTGFINHKGELVLDVPLYEDYRMHGPKIDTWLRYSFFEGVAFIQTEKDCWYLIDKKGNKKPIPSEYILTEKLTTRRYSSGLSVVENAEHKFGYINKAVELVIPFKFDAAFSFEGKYARVVYQEKDAIIDTAGNIYYCDELK